MKRFVFMIFSAFVLIVVGCSTDVPPGFVGQVKLRSGWSGAVLSPGFHTCWGYDEMWLVENRDTTKSEVVHVLLQKDQVNFGVTTSLTFSLKDDAKDVLPLFDRVKPSTTSGEAKSIALDSVYETYGRPVVLSMTNRVVMVYTAEMILEGAEKLRNELETSIVMELKNTPMKVIRVVITNFDFPEFITKAQEAAKEAEVKIKQEEHMQKSRLIAAENKMKIAEIDYQTELLEAKTIADANRIIGESLQGETGNAYLRWHEIKVYGEAANGPNNCIFLPMNLMNSQIGYEAGMTPLRSKLGDAMGQKSQAAPVVKVPEVKLPTPNNNAPVRAESEVKEK